MSGLGWSQMDIKAQENITFINEIICGLLTCLWFVFGLEQMHWKRSESVCLCNNAMLRSLWKTGEDMRIRRIIIIMKGEKSKNSSVQGKKKSCAVLEHRVPSSVFAFVCDGWWDSKSSINLGGKAPDTIKIAEFYWSSPLSDSCSSFLMVAFYSCPP